MRPISLRSSFTGARPCNRAETPQHEPAERDPDQDAPHVVTVQGQRADPKQDDHDDDPDVHDFFRPKDIEDHFAGARQEIVAAPGHICPDLTQAV